MDSSDVLTRPAPPPDLILSYGSRPDQVADLRLPGPRPESGQAGSPVTLILFLHGGFWRAAYDRAHAGPLATALAAAGFAVCVPEFRRTGQPGGGWPGTFDDVATAVDVLPGLVAAAPGVSGPLRVLLAGHSAGGHLALWAASRHRLPAGSRWHAPRPQLAGVVTLAAVADLAACYQRQLGSGAVTDLLGGGPVDQPARYASTDPAVLLPAGAAIRLVHGAVDDVVPPDLSTSYAARARAAGDDVACSVIPGTGHFAVIDPLTDVWPQVVAAFTALRVPVGPAPG